MFSVSSNDKLIENKLLKVALKKNFIKIKNEKTFF
jgi:hypothetical protein